MTQKSIGKHTVVQIKCPGIIQIPSFAITTEGEELGTDDRHRMGETTVGPKTIDHNAGPILGFWSEMSSDQLVMALVSKI